MATRQPAKPAKPEQQRPTEDEPQTAQAAPPPPDDTPPPPDDTPPPPNPDEPDLSQSGIGVGTQPVEDDTPTPDTPPVEPRPEEGGAGWDAQVNVEEMENVFPKAEQPQIPRFIGADVFLGQTVKLTWIDPNTQKQVMETAVDHNTRAFGPDEYCNMLLSMLQEPADKDYYQQALGQGHSPTVIVLAALHAQAQGPSGQPSGANLEAHAESVKHLPHVQNPQAMPMHQQPTNPADPNQAMCHFCGTFYPPVRANSRACSNVCGYLLTGHPVYENLAVEKIKIRNARIQMGQLDPNVYPAPPPIIGPRGPTVDPNERWASDPRRVASHQVQTGPGLPPAHLPAKWTGQPIPEEYQDRSSGYGGDMAGAGMQAGNPDFVNPGQPGYPQQPMMAPGQPMAVPQQSVYQQQQYQQPQQFQRQPAPAAPYIPGQDANGQMLPAGGYQPMGDGRTPDGQPWQGQGR